MTAERRFEVRVRGDLPSGAERRVVFHGVNKSGSLAMARVIREAYHADRRAHEFFSDYVGVPRENKDLLRIIRAAGRGHAFFVGHGLFDAFRRDSGQLVLTQLRHPLPRTISAYQWLRNKHAKKDPSSLYDVSAPFPTLEKFVVAGRGISHSQILQFGVGFGPDAQELRRKLTIDEVYERAREALAERVDWFGIAELFEESLFSYAAICELPSVKPWKQDRRNTGRQMVWDLPDATRALVEEVYERDLRLYEWARSTFQERLSRLDLGGDIEAYRAACQGEYKDRLL